MLDIHQTADRGKRTNWFLPATLLVAAGLFLSACASLSKDECLVADWYQIGVTDGANGKSLTQMAAHRKACAKVGVTPDADAYTQGRVVGLQSFCTAERGYQQGERGYSYGGVCPPHLEPVFMQGYLAGMQIYKTNQEIRRLEGELRDIRTEIADVRKKLNKGVIVDKSGNPHEISSYERDAMYERLLFLGREEGRLEGEISTLRRTL